VLPRRAGAELRSCHQDGPVGERLLVQHEVVVTTPGSEQSVLETGTADTLEVRGRNDLICIHIGPTEWHAHAAMCCEWLHLAASCSSSAARYGGFGREVLGAGQRGPDRCRCCPEGPDQERASPLAPSALGCLVHG